MSKKEEKLSAYEELVKKYLDKQVENDTALKNVYDSAKIKDYFKYITELARKQAVNNCAMIEDSQVYKWARDYYLEELPKQANKDVSDKVKNMTEKLDSAIQKSDEYSKATKEVLNKADTVLERACQMSFEF